MKERKHRNTYSYEEKLGAVEDHIVRGLPASEAMEANGVTSKSAFFRWCNVYRTQGAEALRPRKRGRIPKAR